MRVHSPEASRCKKKWPFLQCWQYTRSHVDVKMVKTQRVRCTFGSWAVEKARGRRKGLCTLSKVSKTWGFCGMSKNAGRRGTFEEDLQRRIFRGRQCTRDMFIRAVRRSGRCFPARELRPSGLLRRFCVTGAALRMTWRAKCWEVCGGNSPRHNESERTGTKCREGCTSNIDIRTSPQGERSNTPKVTKRLRKHMLDFTKHCAQHEKLTLKVSKTRLRHLWARSPKRTLGFRALFLLRSTKYCAYHGKWARGIRSAAPATRNHHHVQNQKSRAFRLFHSPNIAPAPQNGLQKHLSFSPMPANVSATCRKGHACHTDEKFPMSRTCHAKWSFRPQNVPDAPLLPHEADMAQKNSTAR